MWYNYSNYNSIQWVEKWTGQWNKKKWNIDLWIKDNFEECHKDDTVSQ